jgi:hypothetical protein
MILLFAYTAPAVFLALSDFFNAAAAVLLLLRCKNANMHTF